MNEVKPHRINADVPVSRPARSNIGASAHENTPPLTSNALCARDSKRRATERNNMNSTRRGFQIVVGSKPSYSPVQVQNTAMPR